MFRTSAYSSSLSVYFGLPNWRLDYLKAFLLACHDHVHAWLRVYDGIRRFRFLVYPCDTFTAST